MSWIYQKEEEVSGRRGALPGGWAMLRDGAEPRRGQMMSRGRGGGLWAESKSLTSPALLLLRFLAPVTFGNNQKMVWQTQIPLAPYTYIIKPSGGKAHSVSENALSEAVMSLLPSFPVLEVSSWL